MSRTIQLPCQYTYKPYRVDYRDACTYMYVYMHTCWLCWYVDMKALKLLVGLGHMTEESMVIGRCTLPDLSALSETQPYDE